MQSSALNAALDSDAVLVVLVAGSRFGRCSVLTRSVTDAHRRLVQQARDTIGISRPNAIYGTKGSLRIWGRE